MTLNIRESGSSLNHISPPYSNNPKQDSDEPLLSRSNKYSKKLSSPNIAKISKRILTRLEKWEELDRKDQVELLGVIRSISTSDRYDKIFRRQEESTPIPILSEVKKAIANFKKRLFIQVSKLNPKLEPDKDNLKRHLQDFLVLEVKKVKKILAAYSLLIPLTIHKDERAYLYEKIKGLDSHYRNKSLRMEQARLLFQLQPQSFTNCKQYLELLIQTQEWSGLDECIKGFLCCHIPYFTSDLSCHRLLIEAFFNLINEILQDNEIPSNAKAQVVLLSAIKISQALQQLRQEFTSISEELQFIDVLRFLIHRKKLPIDFHAKAFEEKAKQLAIEEMESIALHLEKDIQHIELNTPLSGSKYRAIRTPIEISNIILTQEGNLILGINSLIIHAFFKTKADRDLVAEEIIRFLDEIMHSSEVQASLSNVIHSQFRTLSEHLIRAVLQLHSQATVTHIEAKRAILTSLMILPRQYDVGDCFAVAMIGYLRQYHLDQCIYHLDQALSQGTISCNPSSTYHYTLPVLLQYSPYCLNTEIKVHVSKKGVVHSPSIAYLVKNPALKKAVIALGIADSDFEKTFLDALKRSVKQDRTGTLTVEQLIEEIAKALSHISQRQIELAKFYYASVQEPLLVRSWESSLATASFIPVLRQLLVSFLNKFISKRSDKDRLNLKEIFEEETIQNVVNSIAHHLDNKLIRYIYDLREVSSESYGAFLMQIRHQNRWKKVASKEDFSSLIQSALKEALNKVRSIQGTNGNKFCRILSTWLLQEVNDLQEAFYETFSTHLNPYHCRLARPSDSSQNGRLSGTPWKLTDGSYVRNIYSFLFDRFLNFHPVDSKQSKLTAISLFEMVKKISKETPYLPHSAYLLMESDEHECLFLVKHPSLYNSQSLSIPSEEYVEKIIQKGRNIWSNYSKESVVRFIHFLKSNFAEKQTKKVRFNPKIPKDFSIKPALNQLCQQLIESLEDAIERQLTTMEQTSIDNYLFKYFPTPSQKKALASHLVHFADLNYEFKISSSNNHLYATHLCLVVHPRTYTLKIVKADHIGKRIKPITYAFQNLGVNIDPLGQADLHFKRNYEITSMFYKTTKKLTNIIKEQGEELTPIRMMLQDITHLQSSFENKENEWMQSKAVQWLETLNKISITTKNLWESSQGLERLEKLRASLKNFRDPTES